MTRGAVRSAQPRRRASVAVALTLALAILAGCGGGGGSEDGGASAPEAPPETPPETRGVGDEATATAPDSDLGRVVALGEEFLLADLLALGVRPVASTATVAEAGFQGIEGHDTSAITPLPSYERDLERLAALRPDTIITTTFFVEELGEGTLMAIAELVAVPADLSPEEQVLWLGDELGAAEAADALVEEWAAVQGDAADVLGGGGCEVSVATVYPGPSVAAWIAAPNPVPVILEEAGCLLVPSTDDQDPDVAGRVFLSEEQIGLLDAPTLVLLQSDAVEGERDSLAVMEENPLWAGLPAVDAGRVVEVDRLGFPGLAGQIRLAGDLSDALGAAS